jgi:hypothetical protein
MSDQFGTFLPRTPAVCKRYVIGKTIAPLSGLDFRLVAAGGFSRQWFNAIACPEPDPRARRSKGILFCGSIRCGWRTQ